MLSEPFQPVGAGIVRLHQTGGLGLDTRQAGLAYQESYALANFMVQSYGWHKVREILQLLGAGEKTEAAVGKALADFGLDYQGVIREWQAYMGREFGGR